MQWQTNGEEQMFDTKHAACKGQQKLFFAEKSRVKVRQAQMICQTCPVIEQCRDYAIHNRVYYGVWGGYNRTQLNAERRRRGIVLPMHYSHTINKEKKRRDA